MNSEEPRRRVQPSVSQANAGFRSRRTSRSRPSGFSLPPLPQLPRDLPLNKLILAALAVLLIVIVLGQVFGSNTPSSASLSPTAARVPAPASAGVSAPVAPPAVTQPRARIVKVGAALGQMRETPVFNAPPVGKPVKDGDEVLILGPEKKDETGSWRLVLANDVAGWVPATNLEILK
jgi:hypothetical protein